MFTGEVKKRLIEVLFEVVERHWKVQAAVTYQVSEIEELNEDNAEKVEDETKPSDAYTAVDPSSTTEKIENSGGNPDDNDVTIAENQVPVTPLQRPVDAPSMFNQIWMNDPHGLSAFPPDRKASPLLLLYRGNDVLVAGSWDNWTSRKGCNKEFSTTC